MVRLAWHASGTYSAAPLSAFPGGSNGGRLRFAPESTDPANRGLGPVIELLAPFKRRYPSISWADLMTLAGATAVEVAGGPVINWRSGRRDDVDGSRSPLHGRLPGATRDDRHVQDVFSRMGFDPEETVALLGAHVLGKCHANISGFVGPWAVDNRRFSNEFFRWDRPDETIRIV